MTRLRQGFCAQDAHVTLRHAEATHCFASGGVVPPVVPVALQPRLSVLPLAASVRVSWSAPPPYAEATIIALQALAEAGARAFIDTVLRPAALAITAERDAAEAARWADDGGRL